LRVKLVNSRRGPYILGVEGRLTMTVRVVWQVTGTGQRDGGPLASFPVESDAIGFARALNGALGVNLWQVARALIIGGKAA
jgi:hypothetical protein